MDKKIDLCFQSCIIIHFPRWHSSSLREKPPKALKVICLFSPSDLQGSTGISRWLNPVKGLLIMMFIPVSKRSWNKENKLGQLVVWNLVVFLEFPSCMHVFTFFFKQSPSIYFFFLTSHLIERFTHFNHPFHSVCVLCLSRVACDHAV